MFKKLLFYLFVFSILIIGSKSYAEVSSTTDVPAIDAVAASISGPKTLKIDEIGTWKVSISNTTGGDISYIVDWGEVSVSKEKNLSSIPKTSQSSTTFTHSYPHPGLYKPAFTIQCVKTPCSSNEQIIKKNLVVLVGGFSCPTGCICDGELVCTKKDVGQTRNSSSVSKINKGASVSSIGNTKPTQSSINRILKIGIKGEDVKKLQSFLGLSPDGFYGKATAVKVKEWQKSKGLFSDGVFGDESRQKAGL